MNKRNKTLTISVLSLGLIVYYLSSYSFLLMYKYRNMKLLGETYLADAPGFIELKVYENNYCSFH